MKGYSFQELVKLAEAAVKRAGDIMTGDLTAPKVLVSTAQGTEVNALTRKDYVDGEIAKQVSKSGDTMTGNLTTPKVLVSGAQGTESNALTRKDYVDSAIAAGDALRVSKTGDTMTGDLTAPKVLVSGAQGTEVNALTRRDYVNAELAKKLNLTGGTLTGNLTAPAVLVSATQDTSVNALTRKDYVDSAIAAGDALQVSKSGDTMTGELVISTAASSMSLRVVRGAYEALIGNSSVPGDYLFGGKATAGADYEAYVRVSKTNLQYYNGANYNIYHEGRKPTAADVAAVSTAGDTMTGNLFAPAVLVSSAQNTSPNALTRKDYVDGQVNTRAPTTHTHTAAQGNADVIASSYGQIGSYILAQNTSNTIKTVGTTLAGSSLCPASAGDRYQDNTPLSGTWKCMGNAYTNSDPVANRTTLWIRIS